MATLNDLRTKGGIVVTVVIALGLVAFLLGDLLGSGSIFAPKQDTVVGKIDGQEIEYLDFMEKYEQVKAVYGGTSSVEAQEMFNDMVWSDIILEEAYMPSFAEMGLKVTEEELLDMINGQYVSPYLLSQFQYNPEMLFGFLAQAEANPELEFVWNYLQDQAVKERTMSNFMALVYNGMGVNSLELNDAVKAASIVSDAKVISKPYNSIPDSLVVAPSDAAIKEYYEAHKAKYRQMESRAVEYVEFTVEPSKEDLLMAEKEVENIANEFKAAADAFQYARYITSGDVDANYYTAETIAPEYKEYAFGKKKDQLYGPVKEGDKFVMARVADVRTTTNDKGRKVKEAKMATIVYDIVASDATIQRATEEADAFIAAAQKNGFRATVAEQALNVYNAVVGKNDRIVNGMKDGRELVRWAYTSEQGAVSNAMRLDGNFVVATVSGVRNEGSRPLEEVSATIARTLRNEAKAEWVAAQVANAATIEEAAKILDAEVINVKDVAGDATSILGVGPEAKLVGAIAAAEQGAIVSPVAGNFNIYTFVVTDRSENEVKVEDKAVSLDAQLERHIVPARVSDALVEGAEVEDNRVKFF